MMKYAGWTILFLFAGYLVLVFTSQPERVTYTEARSRIEKLIDHREIELVGTEVTNASAVLSTGVEQWLRKLFHMHGREVPCRIESNRIRDAEGEFTLQFFEIDGKVDMKIYTRVSRGKPSATTVDVLRSLFPSARFTSLP